MRYFFSPHFLICLCLAFLLSGCDSTRNDPAHIADSFFVLLTKGKYEEAFKSTSFAFHTEQSLQGFTATVQDLGLGDYHTRSWNTQSVTSKEAHLKAVFTGANGAKIPLHVLMLKESGKWKIHEIRIPAWEGSARFEDKFTRIGHGSSFDDMATRKIPDEKELRVLVGETIRQFNEGLHLKNFKKFYSHTSTVWQGQTSEEQVERAFKTFVDSNITIDQIKNVTPVFETPGRFTADGMLVVKGYYPTKPARVYFDLKYTYELPKWELIGITISVRE